MIKKIYNFSKSIKGSAISKFLGFVAASAGGLYQLFQNLDRSKRPYEETYKGIFEAIRDLNHDYTIATTTIFAAVALIGLGMFLEKGLFADAANTKTLKNALFLYNEIPSFKGRVANADSEVWISGLFLNTTLDSHKDTIEELLKRKIKVKILVAPENGQVKDSIISFYPALIDDEVYNEKIKIAHRQLKIWLNRNTTIQVKTHGLFPTHNLLFIDPNSNDEMHVHSFVYNVDNDQTPVLILRGGELKKQFDIFKAEFERLWDNGIDLVR